MSDIFTQKKKSQLFYHFLNSIFLVYSETFLKESRLTDFTRNSISKLLYFNSRFKTYL